jgi:hypothetical protein
MGNALASPQEGLGYLLALAARKAGMHSAKWCFAASNAMLNSF